MKRLIWKYGVVGTLKARKLIIFGIVQLLLPQNNFWVKADKRWAKKFKTLKNK